LTPGPATRPATDPAAGTPTAAGPAADPAARTAAGAPAEPGTRTAAGAGDGPDRGRTVAGLVLAAGAGRRFGRPKALVRWRGRTLVERAVDLLADGGCDPVVVVLGAGADEVPPLPARTVVNPDWASGMGSSLRTGLAAVAGADVVITLVDTPLLGPESVRRLLAAGGTAAVATYGGEWGHPVLLSAAAAADVAATATGDRGARGWLRDNPGKVTAVPCDGTGDPRDVDIPDDLPPG
jgi:CTP:molybdopterin cytidylyltransferase MocA